MVERLALISSEDAALTSNINAVERNERRIYLTQIAKSMAAKGCSVDIFTRRDRPQSLAVSEWMPGVRMIRVPAGPPHPMPKSQLLPYLDRFASFLCQWIAKEGRYDLLHANCWLSAAVAIALKQQLDIPFIVTFHGSGRIWQPHSHASKDNSKARLQWEKQALREADYIIAASPQARADLLSLYGGDGNRIRVIPYGFEGSFWPLSRTRARSALGLSLERPIVLHCGCSEGVETAIRSFADLIVEHGIEAELLIEWETAIAPSHCRVPERNGSQGDSPSEAAALSDKVRQLETTFCPQACPPELAPWQALATSLGIAERVHFFTTNDRNLLALLYNAADVCIAVPRYEPSALALLEAMACGKPVVASAVGGLQFTVKDGETGYLIPPEAPKLLGERLASLLSNPQRLALFGRQALRHACKQWSWQQVTKALGELYEQVSTCQSPLTERTEVLEHIDASFIAARETFERSRQCLGPVIAAAAQRLGRCFAEGGKVLICGNGGSAAEAQHLAAELVGRFQTRDREGLPAIALTADTALLTAWSNDVSYEDVFARQVRSLGQPGDILIAMSTSGRSRNLLKAFELARERNIDRIALLGNGGGQLLALSDFAICVPSTNSQHIQEVHLFVLHLLCELIEDQLLATHELVWCAPVVQPVK